MSIDAKDEAEGRLGTADQAAVQRHGSVRITFAGAA
jgi:hypothetical protein